ncbi:sigma-54-dependent Fis family transcriptional regulator [Deltaproteobacteria bacterium]|nr:sigma-54-dependent Fis family transcriptional regulator [Deltaproteobacteria bacterium]
MDIKTAGIIGQSTTLQEVFRVLAKVAPTDSTILVTGESGTGKELLVRALHDNSLRSEKPFVPINCGAIPKDLLESELFGHEKGAFTNAIKTRSGRFEMADGGTIFLDEIGEMDGSLQVKILRVLQEKEIERVGGDGVRKVDVRIVAATNRNLEEEVGAGRFREDLFYRLNVIPLHLPPLRERGGDIMLLVSYFLQRFCQKRGRKPLGVSKEAEKALNAYPWPGNIRELENFMERVSILCDGPTVRVTDLPQKILEASGIPVNFAENTDSIKQETSVAEVLNPSASSSPAAFFAAEDSGSPRNGFVWPTLDDLAQKGMDLKVFLDAIEEGLLTEALQRADGVKNQAAEILGIKRTTLIEKLKKRNME